MAVTNSFLTPTVITREALRVLHQKIPFISAINREYDDKFAKKGAKIGNSLNIRLPNRFSVTTSATMPSSSTATDITEESTTLTVDNQYHVPMYFTGEELTMHIDDFSKRYIEPAMAVLAAKLESTVWTSAYKSVYNMVNGDGSALTLRHILQAREILNNELAPMDKGRTALLSSAHSVAIVDALKGLFQDSDELAQQYLEGAMGRAAGFNFLESSHVTDHTTGTAAGTDTTYDVKGATEDGSSITVDHATGITTTIFDGDIITLDGCYDVHPETKVARSRLKQFVVTAPFTGNGSTTEQQLNISPPIVFSGHKQNVSAYPTNDGAVRKIGGTTSETLNTSMAFHKDFAVFATADLQMPQGVDFAAREVMDGISMTIVRDFDISTYQYPCRIDVLFGSKVVRPELACRIHADG